MLAGARLYLIWTPPQAQLCAARTAVECALESGAVGLVQFRLGQAGAGWDPAQIRDEAARLQKLCHVHGALLIVNDDPGLAEEIGADGVHLGQADTTVEAARHRLGPEPLIGLSTHDDIEIARARGQEVDYVGLGPCFRSTTKTLELEPGGPALVRSGLAAAGSLPVFPIGGITAETAVDLARAGARRLAVGAGILAARDPAAVAEGMFEALVRNALA